jgi:hypothetical protein
VTAGLAAWQSFRLYGLQSLHSETAPCPCRCTHSVNSRRSVEQAFLVRVRLPHSPASHSVLPGCEQLTRWSIQPPDVRQLTKKPAGLSALHRWNASWASDESPSKNWEIIASTLYVERQTLTGRLTPAKVSRNLGPSVPSLALSASLFGGRAAEWIWQGAPLGPGPSVERPRCARVGAGTAYSGNLGPDD